MALSLFPADLFPPSAWKWAVGGTPVTGGQPISGPPQTANLAAGGWLTADLSIALLRTLDEIGTWESVISRLQKGFAYAVPILTGRQPWPAGVRGPAPSVPFGDGATFSDTGLFAGNLISAQLAADAYMPAWPAPPAAPTRAQIEMTIGGALRGGEWFAAVSDNGYPHAHKVDTIVSVAGNVYTVEFSPPWRQDFAAGTAIEFDRPTCAMKLDFGSMDKMWPDMRPGYTASPSISLVETF